MTTKFPRRLFIETIRHLLLLLVGRSSLAGHLEMGTGTCRSPRRDFPMTVNSWSRIRDEDHREVYYITLPLILWHCCLEGRLACRYSAEAFNDYHNRFTALFLEPPGWAGARRELLDFMVQEKINRGRHTDHPAGHHSILTNQCPPPPSPI